MVTIVAFRKDRRELASILLYHMSLPVNIRPLTHYDIGSLLGYADRDIKAFYTKLNKSDMYTRDSMYHPYNINGVLNDTGYLNFMKGRKAVTLNTIFK